MPLRPAKELKAEREQRLDAEDDRVLERIAKLIEETNRSGNRLVFGEVPSVRVQNKLREMDYRVKVFYDQRDGDGTIIEWD